MMVHNIYHHLILIHEKIHIVCVYKIHSCSISIFLNKLQIIIQHFSEHCPIIIMGDFNVDILKNNNHGKNKKGLFRFHG